MDCAPEDVITLAGAFVAHDLCFGHHGQPKTPHFRQRPGDFTPPLVLERAAVMRAVEHSYPLHTKTLVVDLLNVYRARLASLGRSHVAVFSHVFGASRVPASLQ